MIRCKQRAKEKGLEFNLDISDILIPTHCPYLGIELKVIGKQLTDNSPSLDRIDNTKGYIKGNVEIISQLANRCKSDLSIDQLRSFAKEIERRHNIFLGSWAVSVYRG